MNEISIAVDNTNTNNEINMESDNTDVTSYADLQRRAEELRAQADALDAQMEAAKVAAIEDMATTVEMTILEAGLDVDDVLRRMRPGLFAFVEQPAKRARKKADGAAVARRQRAVWRDAEGREYKGGKEPAWLKQAREAAGIAETRAYCEQYMTKAVA